jgi:hypothetical protein
MSLAVPPQLRRRLCTRAHHNQQCVLQCGSGKKFDPAAMSPLGSDAPEFSLGLAHTLVSSIESLLSGHSLSVPGPGTFGPLFKYLPPPIRDHLQDRYYNALT